jgi:hypothetical protein
MPKKFDLAQAGNVKLSLTLTAEAGDEIRLLADKSGMTLAQLVRHSLGLYRFVEGLGDNEELCVRNKLTGELTRVAILAA